MLLWTLSACSTVVVREVPVGPPVALYSESTETYPAALQRGATNADVVSYVNALKDRLRAAYDDRAAIRVWAEGALVDTKVKNGASK